MKASARAIVAAGIITTLWRNSSASARDWTGALDVGAARAVSGDSIFRDTAHLEASVLGRWGGPVLAGGFVDFRPILDRTPASSFWYADLGLRGDLIVYRRVFTTLSASWALRHIGLPDGVSNTVGGFGLGAGIGITLLARAGTGEIYLLGMSHASWAVDSEDFAVVDVGLAIGCRLYLVDAKARVSPATGAARGGGAP